MRGVLATLIVGGMLLSGCGGGDSGDGSGSYAFAMPVLNSQRLYAETVTDNENNTINLSYTETVTAVNAGGSSTVLQEASTPGAIIVNGTNYAIQTQSITVNNSGQELSYQLPTSGGGWGTPCVYNPHGPGPDFPLTVGMTWSLSYTIGCNPALPVYLQQGTVLDVESITVPAGTFMALRLQSMITWTDAHGTQRTQTITNWRDVATSVSVKQSVSIAYAGTLPSTGYAVQREIVLDSD
jgi:hypothetical protein